MSINCIALGKRICFYRLKFNITQEKLAALTNCSREYIAYLESGTKTPSLPTLIDLANVLHPSNQFSKSPKNKNSQRIMWFIPHNTLAIRFTYCLYRSIPFFSSINFPSKISCNTCLHGIRCNLLTSDASITRKVVW